jgi:carbon storage regulator CsrA
MLVLTRRDGETIRLRLPNGDEIEITLISGGPCRLGITAPGDVEIERTEIAE